MTSTVLERRSRTRHGFVATGEPPASCWRPRQVHGDLVVRVWSAGDPPLEADGAVTSVPGLAVGIASADCVPLLLACVDPGTDRRPAAVAAVHAGWRGLVAGVVEAGVAAVRAVGGGAADGAIVAALGPAAGPCCYEVGPEVIAALRLRPGEVVAATRDGRGRIDLRTLVVTRLLRSGLAAGNIEVVGPCTICSRDWPSYRREGAAAGRILSFIEIR